MKQLVHHIKITTLTIGLVFLAVVSAVAQVAVHQGDTTHFEVEQKPGDSYTWELYKDSTVNFASAPSDVLATEAFFLNGNTGNAVDVVWLQAGIYFVKVTAVDAANCTNNLELMRIEILEALPEATLAADSICIGDPAALQVTLTGTGPWSVTYTDGTNTWTETDIPDPNWLLPVTPSPTVTTDYWITEITDLYGTNTTPTQPVSLTVYPKPNISRIYLYDE